MGVRLSRSQRQEQTRAQLLDARCGCSCGAGSTGRRWTTSRRRPGTPPGRVLKLQGQRTTCSCRAGAERSGGSPDTDLMLQASSIEDGLAGERQGEAQYAREHPGGQGCTSSSGSTRRGGRSCAGGRHPARAAARHRWRAGRGVGGAVPSSSSCPPGRSSRHIRYQPWHGPGGAAGRRAGHDGAVRGDVRAYAMGLMRARRTRPPRGGNAPMTGTTTPLLRPSPRPTPRRRRELDHGRSPAALAGEQLARDVVARPAVAFQVERLRALIAHAVAASPTTGRCSARRGLRGGAAQGAADAAQGDHDGALSTGWSRSAAAAGELEAHLAGPEAGRPFSGATGCSRRGDDRAARAGRYDGDEFAVWIGTACGAWQLGAGAGDPAGRGSAPPCP